MPTLLKDLRINEVSSVDRGAGEGVKVMLYKREFSAEEREQAASTGAALPDGSFPIKTVADLENAVHAYGRAKDKAKAKAHIISRAHTLGATDKLPEGWITKGTSEMTEEEKKAKEKTEKEEMEMREKEKAEKAFNDAVNKRVADVLKAKGKGKPKGEGVGEDNEDDGDQEAEKKGMCKALAALRKLSAKHSDYLQNVDWDDDTKAKFLRMDPHEREQHIAANPDPQEAMPPSVKKALAEAAVMKAEFAKLQEERAVAQFEKRAAAIGLPETAGETLRKAYAGDATAIAKLEQTIKGLTAQAETAILFKEFGHSGSKGATAADEVALKVADLRKASPKLSEAQAFNKVYTDPANAELKKRYDDETSPLRRRA